MPTYHDQEYKKLLQNVLNQGTHKDDRTNTGTVSLFCPPRCSFDLSDKSIPLLTIKKMNTNSIIHELLWYISGDSNIKYLQDNNVKIWNEWADEHNKDLGPVYGSLWRSFPPSCERQIIKSKPIIYPQLIEPTPIINDLDDVINNNKLYPSLIILIHKIWMNTVHNSQFSTCSQWKKFSNFLEDVQKLPNFFAFKRNPAVYNNLTCQYYNQSNKVFDPSMCVWVDNRQMQELQTQTTTTANSYVPSFRYDTGYHYNLNTTDEAASVTPPGFKSIDCFIDNNYHHVVRYPLHVDQLQNVIEQIKHNPSSRRHIITAWHPSLLPEENTPPHKNPKLGKQALPACHFQMQFNVRGDILDLLLNMRSNDLFLGAPFNIVQYSMLLRMVAQVTNLKPGVFYHCPADAHIYSNHLEQCNTILNRQEFESPTLELNPDIKNIDDFKFNDFEILNYQHHGFVKASVAI